MLPAGKDSALLFLHSRGKRAFAWITRMPRPALPPIPLGNGERGPRVTGWAQRSGAGSALGQAAPLLDGGSLEDVLFVLCGFSLIGDWSRIEPSTEDWIAVFFEKLSIRVCWRFLKHCELEAVTQSSSLFPPSPPRGRGISKALPFLSWWLREDTAPKESVLSGEWSRSFQSGIPALDSYPSWAAASDVVVLGKRELECPVFITNTVREHIAGDPRIPSAQRPGGGHPSWL